MGGKKGGSFSCIEIIGTGQIGEDAWEFRALAFYLDPMLEYRKVTGDQNWNLERQLAEFLSDSVLRGLHGREIYEKMKETLNKFGLLEENKRFNTAAEEAAKISKSTYEVVKRVLSVDVKDGLPYRNAHLEAYIPATILFLTLALARLIAVYSVRNGVIYVSTIRGACEK